MMIMTHVENDARDDDDEDDEEDDDDDDGGEVLKWKV